MQKFPYTIEGLIQKHGDNLQQECRENLNLSLSSINRIGKMAGIENIITNIIGTDNPLKFLVTLQSGKTLIAERYGWFINQYIITYKDSEKEYSLNTYNGHDKGLTSFLKNIYVTLFNECKYRVETHDVTYEYADDHRSWAEGNENRKIANLLFKSCTPEEQAQIKQLKNAEHFNF